MAILSIDDLDTEPKFSDEESGARTYVTRHLITVDEFGPYSEADILTDPHMPQRHITTMATDIYATCRTFKLKRLENERQWELTVKWSTHRDTHDEDKDPFARVVAGGIRCLDKEVPAFADSRGIMTRNTAGDLYKNLTITANIEIIDVTLYTQTYPFFLRRLNNTVNAGTAEMFGDTYDRRTLWLKNTRLPKNPTEQWGTHLWETTYEIHHDPTGYYQLLPNRGVHELVYWLRTEKNAGPPRTFNEWKRVDWETYDAETDDDLKQVTRERVETGGQQSTATEVWLNEYGEDVVPTLKQLTATATVTAGSAVVNLSGGAIDESFEGTMVTLKYTTFQGKTVGLQKRIKTFVSSTAFLADSVWPANATGIPIEFAGSEALYNYFELQTAADWSSLPLPAEPPPLPWPPVP